MTEHEADVIGGLNMTDQISNEAYKKIMIAAQDENEVSDVLDKIRAEIEQIAKDYDKFADYRRVRGLWIALDIIDKYKGESEESDADSD